MQGGIEKELTSRYGHIAETMREQASRSPTLYFRSFFHICVLNLSVPSIKLIL